MSATTENDLTEGGCLKPGAKKLWKFVHHEDFQYEAKILKGRNCSFNFLEIVDGMITVKGSYNESRGYAWDGCTPKFNLLHITWGNFDGKMIKHKETVSGKTTYHPMTYYASMVHDVLYQYKRCVPVTRKEADLIFYQQLKEAKFMWAWFFYAGVRLFGWWFRGWKYKSPSQIEEFIKE
ncbi:DUF1353 domain-containing protein [Ekhidna sp. MALMAid0563]|uniref:DUF1353 domain-containing protein n=1 Tax=Ekhidna sp. MALMAid0563 TaxID=3143937 RepID=UPI0032DEAB8D